jgi:hypothetical protein
MHRRIAKRRTHGMFNEQQIDAFAIQRDLSELASVFCP